MRARVVMAALVAAICLGCSSSGSGGGAGGASGAAKPSSRQGDLILESEIAERAGEASNALQIIQKLRPQMLRSRGMLSPGDAGSRATLPKVYVDNVAYGGIESLSNLNSSQIRQIQYVNANDATTRWGTGHVGGVILVTTKK